MEYMLQQMSKGQIVDDEGSSINDVLNKYTSIESYDDEIECLVSLFVLKHKCSTDEVNESIKKLTQAKQIEMLKLSI